MADDLKVHMAGLFGLAGKRKTWCGRYVDDDQLPIIGTRRTANCKACARSAIARGHAKVWGYSYKRRWRKVLNG